MVVSFHTEKREVWIAVAAVDVKGDFASIKAGEKILGLDSISYSEIREKLSDWCHNNGISPSKIELKKGFVANETGYAFSYLQRII